MEELFSFVMASDNGKVSQEEPQQENAEDGVEENRSHCVDEDGEDDEPFVYSSSDVHQLGTKKNNTRKRKSDTFERIDSILEKLEGEGKSKYFMEKNAREIEKHDLEKEVLRLEILKRKQELVAMGVIVD